MTNYINTSLRPTAQLILAIPAKIQSTRLTIATVQDTKITVKG